MENDIERRNIELIEFRVGMGEDKKPVITGHAAMFNKLSEILFDFREKIAPGAFTKSIKKDDVRALFNHDPNYVLGRNLAKTLKLSEDDLGLAIEIDPPDTQWARDLQESIRRGDISQMSFGFHTIKDEWFFEKGKIPIRTLTEVQLFDVSPVTYPAYPSTSVACRDYLNSLKTTEQSDGQGALKQRADSLVKARFNLR